ncbi:hypothetical protein QCA50_002365 [Cerrena zonata]|uniref:Uncharacterized protein n=1 Tax=Cerrena zonata TaxID=2478898 RepID=A0AAW0GPN2_9APHY
MSYLRLPAYRSLHQLRYHPYPRLADPVYRECEEERNNNIGIPVSPWLLRTLLEAPGQRVLVINLGTVLIEMTRGVIDEDWLNLYSWEGMVVLFAQVMHRRRQRLE